jgi:hypothetical protein
MKLASTAHLKRPLFAGRNDVDKPACDCDQRERAYCIVDGHDGKFGLRWHRGLQGISANVTRLQAPRYGFRHAIEFSSWLATLSRRMMPKYTERAERSNPSDFLATTLWASEAHLPIAKLAT